MVCARAGALLLALLLVCGAAGSRSSTTSQAQPPDAYGSLVEVTDAATRAAASGMDFTPNGRFFTSSHFKKLRDASGWKPTPCSAR